MKFMAALLALTLTASASAEQLATLGAAPFGLPPAQTVMPAPPAQGRPVPGTEVIPEDQRTNFSYGEMNQRLKKIIIGRKLKFKADIRKADRVDRGEIKWIVVHSAMGSCKSAINTMETPHEAAAHFIVCKDGGVTRLVDIKNISLHVKTDRINDASVGIETETGRLKGGYAPDDWDPASKWKMYSSLAWLIRAVAEETKVPRVWGDANTPGIIGHLEADKDHTDDRGRHDGHTDPGDDFYHKTFPAFDARFPGQSVTPQTYLMMLVQEDKPPTIERVKNDDGEFVKVSDSARAGLAKVQLFDASAKPGAKPLKTWLAPEKGMPPEVVQLPVPGASGVYNIEAYDLVGNKTLARLTVAAETGAILSVGKADVSTP